MTWCRLWVDMPNDPKFRTIARKSGQSISNVIAVFIHMMTIAAQSDDRGSIDGWVDEDVASALDLETEDVAVIREAMQGRVLDGDRLSGWDKRQPNREDGSAERARAWREKQKTQPNATERNRTQPNAQKRPDTDTDTDTEKAVAVMVSSSARVATPAPKETAAAAILKGKLESLAVPWTEIVTEYHNRLPRCLPCLKPTERLLDQIARLCDPVEDQMPQIENWRMFFDHVAKSPLLQGQAPPREGYDRPFTASLEWLTNWDNFMRVAYGGNYHAAQHRHVLPQEARYDVRH